MKEIYEVDENGYIINIDIGNVDENGNVTDEGKTHYIEIGYQGLLKAKWYNGEWVEGATQEEIDEMTKIEPTPPTEMELLKAELSKTNEEVLLLMELLLLGGM